MVPVSTAPAPCEYKSSAAHFDSPMEEDMKCDAEQSRADLERLLTDVKLE